MNKLKKFMQTAATVSAILFALSTPTYAATTDIFAENSYSIGVYAMAKFEIEGEFSAPVVGDEATVVLDDGVRISAKNTPDGSCRLVIIPFSQNDTTAYKWVTDSIKDKGAPLHAYDIFFIDNEGNRINAEGALITLSCPHCTSEDAVVCSLTPNGTSKLLSAAGSRNSLSFTTDGSHYYVSCEKLKNESGKVEIKDNEGGKTEVDKPQAKPGEQVTVKPKPDGGKKIDNITVTDKDGHKIPVKNNGDGTYTYIQPQGGATVSVTYADDSEKSPQTGDTTVLSLWTAITAASGLILVILLLYSIRREKDK